MIQKHCKNIYCYASLHPTCSQKWSDSRKVSGFGFLWSVRWGHPNPCGASDPSMEITQQMPYTRIFIVVLFIITPALSIFFGKDCRSDRDCPRFLGSGRPGKCQVIPNYGCQIWNFFGGKKQCRDGAWCLQCLKNEDCSQVLSVRQVVSHLVVLGLFWYSALEVSVWLLHPWHRL